jgi:sec-independent protein translocase protein TatC
MPERKLTFLGHLEELRGRVIKSLASIVIFFALFYAFIDLVLPALVKPVEKLVFIAPQEAFIARIKIAFFGGLFLSLPFVLYHIWRFISDGLNPKERKYVLIFGPLSFVFFVLGAGFGYFIIVPIGIKFLLGFATDSIVPMISLERYVSFVGTLIFAFGIVFQLPLIISFLTKIGVVTPRFLSKRRRYAVVFIFITAAVLTPPDVVTQLFMAVPLLALYEVGIVFSRFVYTKNP